MFIRAATSQNAGFAQSVSIALPGGMAPQPIGSLGLTIPAGTPGIVSVQFQASAAVAFAGKSLGNVAITIVRGALATDPLVYSSLQTAEVLPGNKKVIALSATASDYNVPIPPSRVLEYTAFIASDNACTRIGSESFEVLAFNVVT